MKLFHDTFIFLWRLGDKEVSKRIKRSKSRSLTSDHFVQWARKLHKENLVEEIDDINCSTEVLTQFSEEDLNSIELVHDINKFEEEDMKNKLLVKDMPPGSVDIQADPEVTIPEKISPNSSTNLEIGIP